MSRLVKTNRKESGVQDDFSEYTTHLPFKRTVTCRTGYGCEPFLQMHLYLSINLHSCSRHRWSLSICEFSLWEGDP